MAESHYRALRSLRRTRQLHRLGNIEWFEAAYRVYIMGLSLIHISEPTRPY